MGNKLNKFLFSAISLVGTLLLLAKPEPVEDKRALLDFLIHVSYSHALNWDENTSVCSNWTGVTCNHDQSRVIAVRLPGFRIHGSITPNTLSRLSALQTLSLRYNHISGPFPSDCTNLQNLSIINLSNNNFNGTIPSSLANLTHLRALNLSNNSFSGDIPDLNIPGLQDLDLSSNNLSGTVPRSLQRFSSWAFAGNNLTIENSPPPVPLVPPSKIEPSKKSTKLSESAILGIAIGGCALGFFVLAVIVILCYSSKDRENGASMKSQKEVAVVKRAGTKSQDENGMLVFFEGCHLAFDLEDLLRASAEVLGKGTFGTTYKATLEDATTIVVKRLKEVSVGKREFEQHMEVVRSAVRHENVAALRAYYYSKDEKLMVYDYFTQGSVYALLHAKRGIGEGRTPLDWDTRLRIAVGAARGIAHIHSQSGGKLVHGNIKASNIFLNTQQYGCVSDLGLATLMSPTTPPVKQTPGYWAPEVTDTHKVSQASEVYSYGVLLLELLTGKSPIQATGSDETVHLVRWVHSVVREEWTAEVFDVELLKFPNIEEEMVEMLQIGLACASRVPEQRPKMPNVMMRVEGIRRPGTGSRPSSEGSTPPAIDVGSSLHVRR